MGSLAAHGEEARLPAGGGVRAIAARAGARLVRLPDAAAHAALREMLRLGDGAWLDIDVAGDGNATWGDGSAVTWTDLVNPDTLRPSTPVAGWRVMPWLGLRTIHRDTQRDPGDACIVLEWDR